MGIYLLTGQDNLLHRLSEKLSATSATIGSLPLLLWSALLDGLSEKQAFC